MDATHIFFTSAGNRYDITLALATATDTIPGSQMSGYAWKHNLSPVLEAVLMDSLPNTCFNIVDIDTTAPPGYQTFAANHLLSCGYVITSVGKQYKTQQITLSIYPNPFKNKFTVKTNSLLKSAQLDVFDSFGRKVGTTKLNAGEKKEIDLTTLLDGNYIIVLLPEDGRLVTAKVLKKQ